MAVEKLGIDERLFDEGGIRIYTTLDPEAQRRRRKPSPRFEYRRLEQQAALVSIDPRTGYIKAMVGGRDYKTNQFNRVFAQYASAGLLFQADLVFDRAAGRGHYTRYQVQERADGLHLR